MQISWGRGEPCPRVERWWVLIEDHEMITVRDDSSRVPAASERTIQSFHQLAARQLFPQVEHVDSYLLSPTFRPADNSQKWSCSAPMDRMAATTPIVSAHMGFHRGLARPVVRRHSHNNSNRAPEFRTSASDWNPHRSSSKDNPTSNQHKFPDSKLAEHGPGQASEHLG